MVRTKIIFAILIFNCITSDAFAQKEHRDIECFISMQATISTDTVNVGDTLWIKLELKNIFDRSVHIYPKGIIFLEMDSPVYNNQDLIQISERITKKTEITVNPDETITNIYPIVIKESNFKSGENIFKFNHITYPFWLSKKDQSKKIFGKLTSNICTLYVL
ncbi:MAG: hypothetical protein ACP5E3_12095 [Bacteroidales bacterium]